MNDRIYVEMIFFFSFIIVVLKQNMPGIGKNVREDLFLIIIWVVYDMDL